MRSDPRSATSRRCGSGAGTRPRSLRGCSRGRCRAGCAAAGCTWESLLGTNSIMSRRPSRREELARSARAAGCGRSRDGARAPARAARPPVPAPPATAAPVGPALRRRRVGQVQQQRQDAGLALRLAPGGSSAPPRRDRDRTRSPAARPARAARLYSPVLAPRSHAVRRPSPRSKSTTPLALRRRAASAV